MNGNDKKDNSNNGIAIAILAVSLGIGIIATTNGDILTKAENAVKAFSDTEYTATELTVASTENSTVVASLATTAPTSVPQQRDTYFIFIIKSEKISLNSDSGVISIVTTGSNNGNDINAKTDCTAVQSGSGIVLTIKIPMNVNSNGRINVENEKYYGGIMVNDVPLYGDFSVVYDGDTVTYTITESEKETTVAEVDVEKETTNMISVVSNQQYKSNISTTEASEEETSAASVHNTYNTYYVSNEQSTVDTTTVAVTEAVKSTASSYSTSVKIPGIQVEVSGSKEGSSKQQNTVAAETEESKVISTTEDNKIESMKDELNNKKANLSNNNSNDSTNNSSVLKNKNNTDFDILSK